MRFKILGAMACGRVHRTANRRVRCSLVRTVRTEQCEQRTVRTSEIVRTVRTTNCANKPNCANSANNEQCEQFDVCEQCEQRTVRTVHTGRTVRTANRANSSHWTNSANSEPCEQFTLDEQRTVRTVHTERKVRTTWTVHSIWTSRTSRGKVDGLKGGKWTVAKVDGPSKVDDPGLKWTVFWREVDGPSESRPSPIFIYRTPSQFWLSQTLLIACGS